MSDSIDNTLTAYLGPEFQQRLMWQLLVEPEFAEKIIPDLAIEYFDDPNLKRLFIIILEYWKEFEKVPNLQNQSIHQAISKYKTPNNLIEEESLYAVVKRIELWNERTINKQSYYDGDVVQKSATAFIKQQEYRKIGEFILNQTKNGEIRNKHTIAIIEDKFQKVAHIGDEEDNGTEVIDNIAHALRKEFRQTIPTGVNVIDSLTGGGLGRGEIGVVLTPSGVGKTTLLTKIANTAYEDGKNVCQIIFEDTTEQIQRKHFTIWSKVALSKMDDNLAYVDKIAHEKAEELRLKGGKLIIKKFSQEDTTMRDIRNWIIKHQKKFGYKFDLIVLDYLDCLEPHKKTVDRNEAELQIIKAFEALASDLNIPAWTAIQTNRSGFDSEFVEAYQTGGSIKRIQKAHFFMSVAKTPEQKEASLANIRIIKARFAQDGQTFKDCTFNNDTMEIIIEDPRYPIKGLIKMTEDDLNKIENTAALLNKSSELPMHSAISKHSEGSLMGMLSNPMINDFIGTGDTVANFEKDKTLIPDNVASEIQQIQKDRLLEDINVGMKAVMGEPEQRFVGGVDAADNNSAINILEIEGAVEKIINTEGINEGTTEGIKSDIDENFFWTGETHTTNVNQEEVKLEDIPDKIINIEEKIVDVQPVIQPEIPIITHQPVKINMENLIEIEKTFEDPDTAIHEHHSVYEALQKMAKEQNLLKKT